MDSENNDLIKVHFCPQCGKKIETAGNFCPDCGAPLSVNVKEEQVVETKSFYVKKLPVIAIICVTLFSLLGAGIAEEMQVVSFTGLILLGCAPPIALLFYIYRLDRIEPEPTGLIIMLMIFGALSIIPPVIVGSVFDMFCDILGVSRETTLYMLIENFLAVALIEESSKYLVVKKLTWKHPAFNYRFDGVVYAATASLGFALLENIIYIAESGIGTGIARAATAIPGHCMFGIYMGYYYGQAKSMELDGKPDEAKALRKKGLLMAVLIHGSYDFLCGYPSFLTVILFLVFVVVLNVMAYINVNRYSASDRKL
ncbi:MAG: PrsW family intramembrane metalloprotease [Lachnospiraceae bacterium]|nr:PrsW family intramembrane metalloprotease [Lachnospiraceae bacterium]